MEYEPVGKAHLQQLLDRYLNDVYGSRCPDRFTEEEDDPEYDVYPCACCLAWKCRDIILEYSWTRENWGKDKEV